MKPADAAMTIPVVCLDLTDSLPRVIPLPRDGVVLALGNFDGVHIAHTALLKEAIRQKEASPLLHGAGVFCFWKPSSDYVSGDVQHLTPLKEKLRLFAEAGLDFACFCDFTKIRHLRKDDFLGFLTDSLSCRTAVCGYNYRFGQGGQGTASDLVTHFASFGGAAVLPAVQRDGLPVSSTRIRSLLLDGKPAEAAELLGHPYALETTVRHGKHLGRVLGFPTVNQSFLPDAIIPSHGVYAVRCRTPYGWFAGVANVGVHPTVDEHARVNCETYLLGLNADLYGQSVRIEFLEFIRPEQRFGSPEQLTDAIRNDVRRVSDYFERHPIVP